MIAGSASAGKRNGGQRIRLMPRPVRLIGQGLSCGRGSHPGFCAAGCGRARVSGRRICPQTVLVIGKGPLVQHGRHVGCVSLQPERHAQRVSELPATRMAIFGSLCQGTEQDVINGGRKVGPPRRQPRRLLRHLRVQHRHVLIPGKWRSAGPQLERRARERVLIGARVDPPPLDLLGRAVMQRAHEAVRSGEVGRRQRALGQAEVRQIHVVGPTSPRIQEHVGRLDITVHQPRGVSGVQRRRHPGDDRRRTLDG